MKKQPPRILLAGYFLPWAFLGPWTDGIHHSMLGYGAMIAGYTVMYLIYRRSSRERLILPGNLVSLVSSLLFVRLLLAGTMEHYFKPFTSTQLTVLVGLIALGIQMILLHQKSE